MNVIVTEHLTKAYGPRRGVEDLSLSVAEGAVFGFLGPNGAGKTTLIRVLLGLLRPTSGVATIFGLDCTRQGHRIKRDVGYLPGDLRLYPWMTGRSALGIFGAVRGMDLLKKGRELAERFALDLGVRVRRMSRGMKQKLGLILTFAHEPRLLILDEPSSALDPLMQLNLRDYLLERAHAGCTVFFSSHTLSEVEDLYERVAIVREGRLVATETLAELRRHASRVVVIRWREGDADANGVPVPDFLDIVERRPDLWRGLIDGPDHRLLAWAAKLPIDDLTISEPDLETLFRGYYADASAGGGAMNLGVIRKSLRETMVLTAVCSTAFGGVLALLAVLFPMFYEEGAAQWFRMQFVRVILSALLGNEVSADLSPATLMAFPWVHPLVLTLLLVHLITYVTRVPAGEIDRGTIDMLLSLPVSRGRIDVSETFAWLGSGMVMILIGAVGFVVSIRQAKDEFHPSEARLALVLVNLFVLYASVGGVTWLCSALSDRRGRAVAVAFGVVFSSFLINFIAQIWAPAQKLSFLSVLTYYRPMRILGSGEWQVRDLAVLMTVGLSAWVAGLVVFRRRDVAAT